MIYPRRMTETKPSLSTAYAVRTPDDNRRLYAGWAHDYDGDLAVKYDYVYPARIAALFDENGGRGPVLDAGCGTGLVGAALRCDPVDGVDLSPEMLQMAKSKAAYRNLDEADLNRRLPFDDGAYNGVVSAGVFTEGHVGPEALDELIRVAAPCALFALGVNERVFDEMGFDEKFDALAAAGSITDMRLVSVRIYGDEARHENAANLSVAAVFRKAD